MSEIVFMLSLVVSQSVFILSMIILMCFRLHNGFVVMERRRKFRIVTEFNYVGRFLLGIVILCKNVIFKLIVEMASMLSFLPDSFPVDPSNQVVK